MRLWTLHPRYLDRQGLVALWREALLAQKVLQGQTTGYRHHPQLVRFRAMPDPVAVRGTGSAAFIGGTLLAGQAVSAWGLGVIVGPRSCGSPAPGRLCARQPAGCAGCCGCHSFASSCWWPPSSWAATPCTMLSR